MSFSWRNSSISGLTQCIAAKPMEIEPGSLLVVHHERSLSRKPDLLCILAVEDLHAILVSIILRNNLLYHCFAFRHMLQCLHPVLRSESLLKATFIGYGEISVMC
jgi:hypothetical protein